MAKDATPNYHPSSPAEEDDTKKSKTKSTKKKSSTRKSSTSSSSSSDPKYKTLLEQARKLLDTRTVNGHEVGCRSLLDSSRNCQCNVTEKKKLVAEIDDYL